MFIPPYRRPRLTLPFEAAHINPHAQAAERHSIAWVRHFDLLKTSAMSKKLETANFWKLCAFIYPYAAQDDLFLMSDWLVWLAIQDAHFRETRTGRHAHRMQSYVATALNLLRQPRVVTVRDDGALLASLAEVWQRLRARMTPDMAARFIEVFERYITRCSWELENRTYGYVPTQSEYSAIQRDATTFNTCALLIEMSAGELGAANQHLIMQRMQRLSNNVVSLTADLFSFERDAKRDDMHNLVLILHLTDGLPLQMAVDTVVSRIQSAAHEFVALESALPSFGQDFDGAVSRYVAGLKACMTGALAWAKSTEWYDRHMALDDDLKSILG